jgi:hypothetical protein
MTPAIVWQVDFLLKAAGNFQLHLGPYQNFWWMVETTM